MGIPRHIAIIMDGNGRWATKRMFGRSRGHVAGCKAIMNVLDVAYDLGIFAVSVYAFSTENWKRPQKEIDKIFDILSDYLKKNDKKLLEHDCKFVTMGNVDVLPTNLRAEIERVKNLTKDCVSHVFNMGLNYGGRDELARAYNKMFADGVNNVNEAIICKYLDTSELPDPDLMIRTAGEQRLSNFMLYQNAYAELYFTDTLWPDFGESELKKALEWFDGRNRTYGQAPKIDFIELGDNNSNG